MSFYHGLGMFLFGMGAFIVGAIIAYLIINKVMNGNVVDLEKYKQIMSLE